MRSSRAVIVLAATLLAAGAPACSNKPPDKDSAPGAGCKTDMDCKGDRVCVNGTCQDAPAKGAGSAAPAGSTQATAAPTSTAHAGSEFRAVPESEWAPVLGPRMRVGAVAVHQVYEGPIGPTPKSMFMVTKEGDEYFATVWSDGHGHRSPPIALQGSVPSKIPAVAFFDADGDGQDDALVLAFFTAGPNGGADGYSNALLKWNGTSLIRLSGLEKEISALDSVAAVRKKLKR